MNIRTEEKPYPGELYMYLRPVLIYHQIKIQQRRSYKIPIYCTFI